MDFIRVRTHPTFLTTLISKYDYGPVKLPGLSRNGPQINYQPETTAYKSRLR